MKIPYFCCIGAELKRYAKDFDFMNQVYLYKVPADDSIEEVLAEDYFKAISDSVLQDDLVYIYEASEDTLHSCKFDKQNGHITAVPLASDETLTGAVTTIIHDNLTKNRAVISNNDGKIAVSEVTSTELGYLHGATSNIQEQLNEKAKTDLSNLTSAGKNIANWSSNVTNCITENPQDIKLELNNGTLTIKAGSKVYVPNGAGVFDTITLSVDKTLVQNWSVNEQIVLAWYDNNLTLRRGTDISSGETDSISGRFHWWYDTTNNVIKEIESDGTARTNKLCLPIAVITMVGDGTAHVSTINKIYNGIGCLGSSFFVNPGVSFIIPQGRNADGTLKNSRYTTTGVIVRTNQDTGTALKGFLVLRNDGRLFQANAFIISKERPVFVENRNQYWYNPDTNLIFYYRSSSENTYISDSVIIASFEITGTSIVEFNAKNTFNALSIDDIEYIAHQAMPSDIYIDLSSTTITDGMSLTAPADGYYSLYKASSAAGQMIGLLNAVSGLAVRSYASNTGETLGVIIHVSKGQTITVRNNAGGNTTYFRFIYANGSK